MCVHAPGFGCTIKAHICEKGLKIRSCAPKSQYTAKEVQRLTLQRFSKILDLVEKKFLAVRTVRRLRQSDVNLGSNHLQLTLRNDRISDNSPEEGVLRSTALEVLLTVSYETGQAPEVSEGSCTRSRASHTSIRQPNVKQINITKEQFLHQKEVLIRVTALGVRPRKLITRGRQKHCSHYAELPALLDGAPDAPRF
jgi:hypothetical protein